MELKSKTVIKYLVGTFLLSYIPWGIIILANQFDLLAYGTPISTVFFLIGGFSPTIISCLVLIRQREVSGFKQILKDTFGFRQKPMVYLAIAAFTGLTYLFQAFAGNVECQRPFYCAIIIWPLMIFGGGLEEVGWRYLLQPALEKRFSFIVASAITGVVWIFWHLPLFYIQGTSQNLYMSFPMFAIDVFGTAFVLAMLRKMGKGIWPCVFFHSLNNALSVSFPMEETVVPTIITAAALILCSVIVYYFLRSKKMITNE